MKWSSSGCRSGKRKLEGMKRSPASTPAFAVKIMSGVPGACEISSTVTPSASMRARSSRHCSSARVPSIRLERRIQGLISYSIR